MLKIKRIFLFLIWLVILFPFVIFSCSTNNIKSNDKIVNQFKHEYIKLSNYDAEFIDDHQLIPKSQYNSLIDSMKSSKNTLAISVIYDDQAYIQKVKVEPKKSVWHYMHNKLNDINFKYFEQKDMGVWVGPFYFKSNPNKLLYGKSQKSNYGMRGYPMLFFNHIYAQLGASNYHPIAGQIIEITYNHNS